jgi:hypothetical protein
VWLTAPEISPLLWFAYVHDVFGSMCQFEFTLSLKISDLIQVGLRFCNVFISPYMLGEATTHTLFASPYGLRLAQKLEITKRFKVLHRGP